MLFSCQKHQRRQQYQALALLYFDTAREAHTTQQEAAKKQTFAQEHSHCV
jgi:hypothetical protein